MKKILAGLFVFFLLCAELPPAFAQATDAAAPTQEEPHPPDAGGKRAREFQGDDVGQVIRLLARQAKLNLIIGEAVKGNVSMRLENASALEAIEILVRSRKLEMTKDDKGTYYIDMPEPVAAGLALLAKPEMAEQVALYKRHLYDALIQQKFTLSEALQLTATSDPTALLLAVDRKPELAPAK